MMKSPDNLQRYKTEGEVMLGRIVTSEAFYSSLTREHINDKDYEHAKQVWTAFQCKTLGDYHDLYLRTDVLLLADAFEKFRDIVQQHYGLDLANYFSLPGMSWDALLKKTKIQLELLTDIDQQLFMERGLRGKQAICKGKQSSVSGLRPETA